MVVSKLNYIIPQRLSPNMDAKFCNYQNLLCNLLCPTEASVHSMYLCVCVFLCDVVSLYTCSFSHHPCPLSPPVVLLLRWTGSWEPPASSFPKASLRAHGSQWNKDFLSVGMLMGNLTQTVMAAVWQLGTNGRRREYCFKSLVDFFIFGWSPVHLHIKSKS